MTHDPRPNAQDLDPDQAIEETEFEDPTDPEVTDPNDPNYVEAGVEYGEEQP